MLDLVQRTIQNPAHHFHKAAGYGSAFVVHDEIGHIAVPIQQNCLAVLAADVHYTGNAGAQIGRPFGMTGDFGDPLVGLGQQFPAVAGGDHIFHFRRIHGVIDLSHPLPGTGGGGKQNGFYHSFSIEQGSFCGGGAAVDTQTETTMA